MTENPQLDALLADALRADTGAVQQAVEATKWQEPSGLSLLQVNAHIGRLTQLAAEIEGHNFESLPQIGDAIRMLAADLEEQLEATP